MESVETTVKTAIIYSVLDFFIICRTVVSFSMVVWFIVKLSSRRSLTEALFDKNKFLS